MPFALILLAIVAVGAMCWLLFTFAVFALPLFAGVTAGAWAYGTGAGWLGAVVVGSAAAAFIFAIGHVLLTRLQPLWTRVLVALAFVAPAAVGGFYATHGIVRHAMPSEAWQLAFSLMGAIAVGGAALARLIAPTPPDRTGLHLPA